jgi:hypothetical protein
MTFARPALLCLLALGTQPATGQKTRPASVPPPGIAQRFAAELARVKDLEYDGLERELRLEKPRDVPLGFDVRRARYFDKVTKALHLTGEERATLTRTGLVSVDHQQRYSMGDLYFAIYTRDLPVLVTTDSVLHAWHRSYDHVLERLELDAFTRTIDEALRGVAAQLERAAADPTAGAPVVQTSLADVDLYVTVARSLLAGAGAPADEAGKKGARPPAAAPPVAPRLAPPATVTAVLEKIAGLQMETPDRGGTPLRGGARAVDYSQFRPRGHYTKVPELRRYFRTMMWMGRPDTGFLLQASKESGLKFDASRELRAAAAFVLLLERSGKLEALRRMDGLVDYIVGTSDDLSIADLQAALAAANIRRLEDLADEARVTAMGPAVAAVFGHRGQIRGQVVASNPEKPEQTPPPQVFQVFGQRFGLDSFVLAQLVYDSILFHGDKQIRTMPTGLDVMAAFGNDEAVPLLRPELDRFHYAANLVAARRLVEAEPASHWRASAYATWLDALRTLDDVPASATFPHAMRSEAWRRKQLQTQLASWAELRHDTILYLKQSYTAVAACEYPAGYVEPYPELFARLRALATEYSSRLRGTAGANYGKFFDNFAARMGDLEKLARKELRAQPFTADETAFLKKTIDIRGGGSGPPRYDGWYPQLFAGGQSAKWSPVVADVHTDAETGRALEAAVGDSNFLVVAIDNQKDTAVYVGPAYSYYELHQPVTERLTNEAWEQLIEQGKAPPRPAWTRPFQPRAVARDLP